MVGFAAETEHVVQYAREKLARKSCDFIVANAVGENGEVFGGADNQVHIVTRDNVISWPQMSKDKVAQRLVELIGEKLDAINSDRCQIQTSCRMPRACRRPAVTPSKLPGLDLMAALPDGEPVILSPGQRALIPTGFAIELPPGFEAQVRPRSGLALNHGVTVLNAPGTIDADYRGEIGVLLINHGD